MSGALTACGKTSNDSPVQAAGGVSGAGASAGAPESGEPGGAGTSAAGATDDGGAGGAVGGAGDAGDASSNAGTSGGPSAGAPGMVVEPYFHAGSRLKPRVFSAGDLEVIHGAADDAWHDVKTGDACRFRIAADGVERCLPVNEFDEDDANQLSYLDAACTQPAVLDTFGRCADEGVHYVTVRPASGCGYRTYRLGAARPSTTRLYAKHGSSCARLPISTIGNDVLPLAEEVPLDTFVAVKRVSRPRHPRMNAWVREGEDGSWQVIGFAEPGHDAPCFGLGLDTSPRLCVPPWLPSWGYFSDAACSQRVAFQPDDSTRCTSDTPTALLNTTKTDASCAEPYSVTELWQLGGVATIPLFNNNNGACEGPSTEPSVILTQGAPIPLASLPQLDVIEVGNGPLRAKFLGFDGVPFLPAPRTNDSPEPGPFIDAARGEPCNPHLFPDGTWRCIPFSFQQVMDFDFFYESQDCTGPRAYNPYPSTATEYCELASYTPRGVFVQSLLPNVCWDRPVTETLELDGESSAPDVSYHGLSSTCRSVPPSAGLHLLKVGRQLNPSDVFVAMELKMKD